MAYHVIVDATLTRQLVALAPDAILAFTDLLVDLADDPWTLTRPYQRADDPLRSAAFGGRGLALVAIDDDTKRVSVVDLLWL